ncbi:hypothetical protein [Photobacterium halotolerans]|nr:hypothetical protein [Photobacterium halotolerans]
MDSLVKQAEVFIECALAADTDGDYEENEKVAEFLRGLLKEKKPS